MDVLKRVPKKQVFFYLVLMCALIIFSVVVLQNPKKINNSSAADGDFRQITIQMIPGANAISLPIRTGLRASDFCSQVKDSVLAAKFNYYQNKWDYYYCGRSVNSEDFPFIENLGYFVSLKSSQSWSVSGKTVESKDIYLPGWNFVGLPDVGNRYTYAKDICGGYLGKRVDILSVHGWVNGGYSNFYCNLPFNNFSIEVFRAYFIYNGFEVSVPPSKLPLLKSI